jgi:hypothetical protein
MRTLPTTIIIQSVYILITAVWPLVDIESFMQITGYKTDVWLVKTVGALLVPVALTLASYLIQSNDKRPALLLGGLTALTFAVIDFYYVSTEVISPIYLLDGLVEIFFVAMWAYLIIFRRSFLKRAPGNLLSPTQSVSKPFQG